MILNSPYITGSLTVTGDATIAGNITVTGSLTGTAATASFALTLGGTGSVGFATTGAFSATSGSASSRLTQIEQVYATTGSNSFRATQSITGSLTVTGQIIAQTLNVQQVTSSIVFSSGSNTFGCDLNSRQTFTGSVLMTGSLIVNTTGPELQVNNNGVILGNLLTDNHSITGSLRVTGSNITIAGALTGSSATFSGRVGIGTTSPDYALTINANATQTSFGIMTGYSNSNARNWGIGTNVLAFGDFTINQSDALGGLPFGAGTSRLYISQAGNVGIATSSPNARLSVTTPTTGTEAENIRLEMNTAAVPASAGLNFRFGSVNGATIYGVGEDGSSGASSMRFYTHNGTSSGERIRITSGGNVGIGTTNPIRLLSLGSSFGGSAGLSTNIKLAAYDNGTSGDTYGLGISGGMLEIQSAENIGFYNGTGTTRTERMRITSGGFMKASNYGGYFGSTFNYHELGTNSNGNWTAIMYHTAAAPYGIYIPYTGASPNSASSEYLYFTDSSALRFSVRSNGGIANFQANDANLSDERTKKDITPLESYWDKFKAIEIVKFKYKDQTHDDFNIGVIAQQVEAVAPEFVDVDGWGKPELDEEGNEIVSDEEPLKSIYTADLHHATIKVLQEAMAKIETQQCTINILKTCIGIA